MSTRRKRKHPTVTITSELVLSPFPARWETELVLAALARLSPTAPKEEHDAAR